MRIEWEIIDDSGAVLYRGSQRACEDWLDLNENQFRVPVKLQIRKEADRKNIDGAHPSLRPPYLQYQAPTLGYDRFRIV